MEELRAWIGKEAALTQIGALLRQCVQREGIPLVGGYHVTCSDETEWECIEAFQRLFAEPLLPALKLNRRAVFRTSNLGGRYEPGAIRIAEDHFALPLSPGAAKLLVVKLNAHVAVRRTAEGLHFGRLDRYGLDSACCGALAGLLQDVRLPAIDALRETFQRGHLDRLKVLRDANRVPCAHRALAAAIVNARLQAERAVDELAEQPPHTPTRFLVLPCVTLNRPDPDTELLVGCYQIDWTGPRPVIEYEGFGDDPSRYAVVEQAGRICVQEVS